MARTTRTDTVQPYLEQSNERVIRTGERGGQQSLSGLGTDTKTTFVVRAVIYGDDQIE